MRLATFAERADQELRRLAELNARLTERTAELDRILAKLDQYPDRCTDRLLADLHGHGLPLARLGPGGDYVTDIPAHG